MISFNKKFNIIKRTNDIDYIYNINYHTTYDNNRIFHLYEN